MVEGLPHKFRDILKRRKTERNLKEAQARIDDYYKSEQDPEHFYEDIIFDPYPDSILRSIHDEELLVMRENTIYPLDKKDK